MKTITNVAHLIMQIMIQDFAEAHNDDWRGQ